MAPRVASSNISAGWNVKIDVEDQAAMERKIRSLLSSVDSTDVERVLLSGAVIIKKEARRRIAGRTAGRGTGNLRNSLVAKRGKARGNLYRSAFAAVNRKKAPHAHLYEAGTTLRRHASGKSTGCMPARPFFWPAVQDKMGEVQRVVTNGIRRLIGREVKTWK